MIWRKGYCTGRYEKVVGNDIRPALGEFKEQLTDALREEGAIAKKEEEGALLGFLRTGYNLYAIRNN